MEPPNQERKRISGQPGENSRNQPPVRGNLALDSSHARPPAVERRKQPRSAQPVATVPTPRDLTDYEPLIGGAELEQLRLLAEPIKGATLTMLSSSPNSDAQFSRLVSLLTQLQITATVHHSEQDRPHNSAADALRDALQGRGDELSDDAHLLLSWQYGGETKLGKNFVVADDAYFAAVAGKRERQHWFWKCDLDLSDPPPETWKLLRSFVEKYDAAAFACQTFAPRLNVAKYLFYPCIDPLSDRNRTIDATCIQQTCEALKIDRSRPLVTHVADFTRDEDNLGVIEAYRLAKRYVDCQLVLAGSYNQADSQSATVLAQLRAAAETDPDIVVVEEPTDLTVNALQRASTIVVQKPVSSRLRTGVLEALWKAKPTIASGLGGIPNQIIHKVTGALIHSVEGCAFQIRYLLSHPDVAEQLGRNGREHVKENFLITSDLKRWLVLFQVASGISKAGTR